MWNDLQNILLSDKEKRKKKQGADQCVNGASILWEKIRRGESVSMCVCACTSACTHLKCIWKTDKTLVHWLSLRMGLS